MPSQLLSTFCSILLNSLFVNKIRKLVVESKIEQIDPIVAVAIKRSANHNAIVARNYLLHYLSNHNLEKRTRFIFSQTSNKLS